MKFRGFRINMKKILICIALVFVLASCTNPSGATKFLEDQGYKNIQIGGYDWFLANKGDISVTHFKAINGVSGNLVEGAVSENWGFFGIGNRWSIKFTGEY
jgi:hypothetical protein